MLVAVGRTLGEPVAQHAKKMRLQWAEVVDSPLLCMVILTLNKPRVNSLISLVFNRGLSTIGIRIAAGSTNTTEESEHFYS